MKITSKKDKNNRDISIVEHNNEKIAGYTYRSGLFHVSFYTIERLYEKKYQYYIGATNISSEELEKIPNELIKSISIDNKDFQNPYGNGFYLDIILSVSITDKQYYKSIPREWIKEKDFVYYDCIFDVGVASKKIEKLDKKAMFSHYNNEIKEIQKRISNKKTTQIFYDNVEYKIVIQHLHSCHHHDSGCPYDNDYPFEGECHKKDYYHHILFDNKTTTENPVLAEQFNYSFYPLSLKGLDFLEKSKKHHKKTGNFIESPIFKGIPTSEIGGARRLETGIKYEKQDLREIKNKINCLISNYKT